EIAQEHGVYTPITTAIYKSIYEGADIRESILNMMSNELRSENEWDKK
ncbi:MAG: glycerol-3-phosphate dehydrogenase, partial [Streptococcus sp.]|nr:glycerol-3-phosphate dehydrogenase [Streptococcus sp.]